MNDLNRTLYMGPAHAILVPISVYNNSLNVDAQLSSGPEF